MRDFLKRLLIAGIMAIFISLLFLGVKYPQAEANETDHWMWPTDGIVTDTYGTRHGRHHGIDIAGGLGTPVYSVDQGVVTKSYYSSSYGHVVFVKHPNHFETVYAHLSKRKVQEGQVIGQGEILGEMGSTGRSSGVHLHFEIHQNEWTANKENSLNPVAILGNIEVGENVHALEGNKGAEVAGVMETTATNMKVDMVRYLPNSDYELMIDSIDESGETAGDSESEGKIDIASEKVVHIVQKGDNLWNIAKTYETTVQVLMDTNHLTSDLIHPDLELIIEQ